MNDRFDYKYTAPTEEERKEIVSIRRQYLPREEKEETKLERLKKLNAKVKHTAKAVALSTGIVSVLVFGTGLTMVLEWNKLIAGVAIALLGGAGMACAYGVYALVLRACKKKYGAEIVKLSDELLGNEKTPL